ncbi:hypothetical protein O5O45_09805 [Hahella aquimaris]|uniref:hypothetical protein n=1 Tax=Hahella sp. HNIBRBA332 TaxID=3015983 RepID=UPI00273C8A51|nr:hypothetical protein [Hahella sp. HNIBRBA332]WLQ16208.1 hypothetical protein O5O45_09805 [Hahella sp. HNIBRBA332]
MMEIVSAWLIHHRASMEPTSPMNCDGSEYVVGVGVVPATSMREALDLFDQYLAKNKMALMDLWKCEQYSGPIRLFTTPTLTEKEAQESSQRALERDCIYYAGGISSEVIKHMEECGHEET